jgi:hypothetical protein
VSKKPSRKVRPHPSPNRGTRSTLTPSQAIAAYLAKLGRRGGAARAKSMTAEERRASAKKAVEARWDRKRPT